MGELNCIASLCERDRTRGGKGQVICATRMIQSQQ